jgi:hypothetical protein
MGKRLNQPYGIKNVATQKPDKITRWLAILNFVFLFASSIGGYFYITRVQQALDDQKFLQGLSGFISALKPVAEISCYNTLTPEGDLASKMLIRNSGTNVFRLTTVSRQLRGAADDAELTFSKEVLPTISNGMEMDISPGQTIQSSEVYKKLGGDRSWQEIEVQVEVQVATSEMILRVAKRILGTRIAPDHLDSFGTTIVRCRGHTEIGDPASLPRSQTPSAPAVWHVAPSRPAPI